MTFDLVIGMKTQKNLTSWELGERLLSAIFAEPKLVPERIATFSEVSRTNGCAVHGLAQCRAHWAAKGTMRVSGAQSEFIQDFHWVRRKIAKSQGAITFTSPARTRGLGRFSSIMLWAQYRSEIDWAGLFRTWCEQTQPYAAMLHPMCASDGPGRNKPRETRFDGLNEEQSSAWQRYLGGGFYTEFRAGELNSLHSGLTNPGWASWFGGDYAKAVDLDKLRAAGFPTFNLGTGYLVQMTETIEEVAGDLATFSRRRAALKGLFRPGLFMIESEPGDH